MKLYSTVLTKVKKRLLYRGLLLGSIGISLIFFMGVWAPLTILELWGLPLFCLGILLIGMGLIPYKNLTRLETHPYQLILDAHSLTFLSSKGGVRVYDRSKIEKVEYWESKTRYGLRLEVGGQRVFLPRFLLDSRLDEIVHSYEADKGP